MLRRLADGGRTVVLVTHATANITQCDHVCFLTQGRMAYYGPPEETFGFFNVGTDDFSDVYDCLDDANPDVARQKAERWEETYRASPQYQQFVAGRQRKLSEPMQEMAGSDELHGPRVNLFRQLRVLTRRYLDLVLRDKLLLAMLMAVMPLVGILLLLISKANWLVGDSAAQIEQRLTSKLAAGAASATYSIVADSQSLLFILAFAAVLLGLFASVYELVKEWSVYQRSDGYMRWAVPPIEDHCWEVCILQCFLLLLVVV